MAIAKYKSAMGNGRIGVNVIIVSEMFHQLRRIFGNAMAQYKLHALLSSPAVDFLDVNKDTAVRALKLARDFNLRINDALIAQQAIELGAQILTDDVKDFGRIGALRIIPMRPSA